MGSAGNPKTRSKKSGGRVTPKGGPAAAQAARARAAGNAKPSDTNSRYTPPQPKYAKESPPWLPVLMFSFIGLGMLLIFLNYTGLLPGGTTGWWLLPGLGCITIGIIAATYYR